MSYLLGDEEPFAGDRFSATAALFDHVTTGHLDRFGIGPGWRCWEVGAGGTSMLHWLAGRAGPAGYVLATDIDTSLAVAATGPTVIVLRHDVAADPPPGSGFDLVHARLVLVHVPDRERALAAMVRALRPGGWLLIEDADPAMQPLACPDERGPDEQLANKIRKAFRTLLAERGADLDYGRTLPAALRATGLVDVAASGYFPLTGPECVALERATVTMVRDDLVAAGLVTELEVAQHLVTIDKLDVTTAPLISAWGRKPR